MQINNIADEIIRAANAIDGALEPLDLSYAPLQPAETREVYELTDRIMTLAQQIKDTQLVEIPPSVTELMADMQELFSGTEGGIVQLTINRDVHGKWYALLRQQPFNVATIILARGSHESTIAETMRSLIQRVEYYLQNPHITMNNGGAWKWWRKLLDQRWGNHV